jgi:hypothetical protein
MKVEEFQFGPALRPDDKRSKARMRPYHQDDIRRKIQAANIVFRLQQHINGELELSSTQIAAAKILLDKTVSNLVSTTISGDKDNPIQLNMTVSQQIDDRLKKLSMVYDEFGAVQPH